MGAVRHYWQFNRLNIQGKVTIEVMAEAKSFIQEQCSDLVHQNPFSDQAMQNYLFTLLQENDAKAELCLRCFISEQIKQVCINLERRFGQNYQFKREDLFPLVLDDTLKRSKQTNVSEYTSMAAKILETFDPQKASLATWTSRRVCSDQRLTQFLLEKGLYLISDWAILNDTTSRQLERIFRGFYHLNEALIQQSCLLLEAYHQVYRQNRLVSCQTGKKGKCPPPNPSQLQDINHLGGFNWTTEHTLNKLQELAEKLREYRIIRKGGNPQINSLDNPETMIQVEQKLLQSSENSETEATQFLTYYREQFLTCLREAISLIVPHWINKQKGDKKQLFLKSLELFHCQGLSMTQIALIIGLDRQDQVTRLMKLKDFRADIRQEMLNQLRSKIIEIATIYTEPEQLIKQEKLIELALAEQVDTLIEEAKSEASSAKNQPLKSIFAQYLCRYLDQQEIPS